MDFAEALNAMRMGSKVSREFWGGRISYWYIKKPREKREGIFVVYPSGSENKKKQINVEDVLATDWWIVT